MPPAAELFHYRVNDVALAYRHPTNTCWLLISLEHKTCDHSEPGNWSLRMTIYETPTLYERMVNKDETITVVAEYEDRDAFDIQDLGEYLANAPWNEVPPRITLDEHEAHKFLSCETVPIGSLVDNTVSSTQRRPSPYESWLVTEI